MTSSRSRAPRTRGFTLVDLISVVAIVGIVASLAVVELRRTTYRTRMAERAFMMDRIKNAVANLYYLREGRLQDGLTGWFNPPLPPGNLKKVPDWSQPGWNQIVAGMGDVEGSLYFSYYFSVWESTSPPLLLICAVGDLEGDGNWSTKWIYYQRIQDSYQLSSEWPPAGQEDPGAF